MTPYYKRNGITIYCGDSRQYLNIDCESIITDPVWPNSAYPNIIDPKDLLCEVLSNASDAVRRIVIHLGCNSDPRFLTAVPDRFQFFRVCVLEYACPNYLGRLLYTADIAYAFGEPPPSRKGAHVIPGKIVATQNDRGYARGNGRDKRSTEESIARLPHPTSRKPSHVRWLVKYFGGSSVCDPFMGSGVTALACKQLGVPFVGVEIEERYCEIAVKRLDQECFAFSEYDESSVDQSIVTNIIDAS